MSPIYFVVQGLVCLQAQAGTAASTHVVVRLCPAIQSAHMEPLCGKMTHLCHLLWTVRSQVQAVMQQEHWVGSHTVLLHKKKVREGLAALEGNRATQGRPVGLPGRVLPVRTRRGSLQ